ncbi:MAG: ABC transporter permease, partial [Pseudomonadota bacterium]
GFLGLSLVTTHDARPYWGTPYDTPDRIDQDFALKQSRLVCGLVRAMAGTDRLHADKPPSLGFATVKGRVNLIRHGELFPDQPARGSVLLAFQGPGRYYSMVDALGNFNIKGVADSRHVPGKVIIEGYRFDEQTGEVVWAIDKRQTTKDAYRLQMKRLNMETALVMFGCKSTTVFDLLEPRSFLHLTKIQLLDARREAEPLKYWWSRIDTLVSTIATFCLEPGTPFKLTLSDTVLTNKMILSNGSRKHPEGVGYVIDEWPVIHHTAYRTAQDMWFLLGPRISNLEDHGIRDERILQLRQEGLAALEKAEEYLESKQYDKFREAANRSWALAIRVYDQVQKTQKDVLFGVLFYIALFVPFAYCLERLLFSFTDIHRRLLAFFAILISLIAVIYKIHPAFELAYSPLVVILAFFILSLSLVVTLIIFFRFEEEMIQLQRRASHVTAPEMSRWQAFAAAFLLGVSNLRRRRLRTALTCITLIILTFTIMSFTSVQTLSHRTRLLYMEQAPYRGVLLKNVNWRSLPPESYGAMRQTFESQGVVAPRVWYENEDQTLATRVPVRNGGRVQEALGLIGLSAREPEVSGLGDILVGGRWFTEKERRVVLLPERMAETLGFDPKNPEGTVNIWGLPYQVVGVFSGKRLGERTDLDGESLTPVTYPEELSPVTSEIEMAAIETGEDVRAFQCRYQHVPGELTIIIPYQTLMAAGGQLKEIAVKPFSGIAMDRMAVDLVDRFRLALFIGEPGGTYLYTASDTLSYSGVPNILIPMAIAVFIVLNTMIGSVYERKREIGIYTSIGLAPSHVSFLFIAESMAFAVLSVVLGYMVAQGAAAAFSGTSLWSGITVNYSSLAGVSAMILVCLVVLLSVIYPSRVAAKIAIPDVNRAWTMPESAGNVLEVELPVLMKYHEIRGLGGYLLEYFKSHQDVSHGLFSTGEIKLHFHCPLHACPGRDLVSECPAEACGNHTCLHFSSQVWLAPFDFGIMQRVDVEFCPTPSDPGFLEIRIKAHREAGEARAWHRINKPFINRLRKQLLIWRSLNAETQNRYTRMLDQMTARLTDDQAEASAALESMEKDQDSDRTGSD